MRFWKVEGALLTADVADTVPAPGAASAETQNEPRSSLGNMKWKTTRKNKEDEETVPLSSDLFCSSEQAPT